MDPLAILKDLREKTKGLCTIRAYNRPLVDGAGGYFVAQKPKPYIVIALQSSGKEELCRLILHEYCHFIQWSQNKRKYNKFVNAQHLFYKWVDGKHFSTQKVKEYLDQTLLGEYECETMAAQLYSHWGGRLEDYYDCAHSYISYIKLAHLKRRWASQYEMLGLQYRLLTTQEILAPLTEAEISLLEASGQQ